MKLNQGKKSDLLNYLFLGLFLFVAYLPASSFLFALKNDALTDNFPNKFFFSASLHASYLPLWNPYVNFGLPLYEDPGFAFWQPVTWIFGLIGYNVYTLTIEVLLYIWLGGIFMYELGKYFRHSLKVCVLMGAMYMASGFFIGNLQHINFITSAAFLPIVVRTFLQLQDGYSHRRLLACALSLYFLITSGHPAIPFATIYFLAAIIIGSAIWKENNIDAKKFAGILKLNFILIVAVALLIVPLLYSYVDVLPYINRSAAVNQDLNGYAGFSPSSYLSFLFPFAITGNDISAFFGANMLMRNGYFSVIGFALLLVVSFAKKNRWQKIFLFSGAIMLLLSVGGPVKSVLYPWLPLLNYIRTNGEFRIFSILSFILVASFPLDKWLATGSQKPANRVLGIFGVVAVIAIVWTLIHHSSTTLLSTNRPLIYSFKDRIKWWLDHLLPYDRLLIAAIMLSFLLIFFFAIQKKISIRIVLPVFILCDLIGAAWLNLPVTGVQKKSVADIEKYFSDVKPGIPVPILTPIKENVLKENVSKSIGCWAYYGKQPGTPEFCDYPVFFNNTREYFESNLKTTINEKPFVFLKKEDSPVITIAAYSPNRIAIDVSCNVEDTIIILQNYYPKWAATVNGHQAEIEKEFLSFMAVPLSANSNSIIFSFTDKRLLPVCIVSWITLLVLLGLAFFEWRRELTQS